MSPFYRLRYYIPWKVKFTFQLSLVSWKAKINWHFTCEDSGSCSGVWKVKTIFKSTKICLQAVHSSLLFIHDWLMISFNNFSLLISKKLNVESYNSHKWRLLGSLKCFTNFGPVLVQFQDEIILPNCETKACTHIHIHTVIVASTTYINCYF